MVTTMKDIARELGVSIVTVSRALREGSGMSASTRGRILRRARELNYRPNLAARALVTGRSKQIGLIVPDLVHSLFATVALSAAAALRSQGYSLIISSSEGDPQLEIFEIDQMLMRGVDALILASTQSTVEHFYKIGHQRLCFLLLDRKIPGLEADFVGVDDVMAGTLATRHLLEIGCRTIAHIAGPDVSSAFDRQAGYRMELARRDMNLPSRYLAKGIVADNNDAFGYTAMKGLMSLTPRPDGVFCYSDRIAVGAMRAIFDAGLRVPEDIALVGCGNVAYADSLRVPLTSIDLDSKQLGERAAKMVLGILRRRGRPAARSVLMPPLLVVRDSTQRQCPR